MHFEEVPIKLYLRRRQPSDTRDEVGADAVETPVEAQDGDAVRSE
jgi:hypothetical protein